MNSVPNHRMGSVMSDSAVQQADDAIRTGMAPVQTFAPKLLPPPANPVRRGRPRNRLVIDDVDWKTYTRLLRALDERHLRFTYDRGVLEIMTLSAEHEGGGELLGV